jgi:hypothetical protein
MKKMVFRGNMLWTLLYCGISHAQTVDGFGAEVRRGGSGVGVRTAPTLRFYTAHTFAVKNCHKISACGGRVTQLLIEGYNRFY